MTVVRQPVDRRLPYILRTKRPRLLSRTVGIRCMVKHQRSVNGIDGAAARIWSFNCLMEPWVRCEHG